MAISNNEEFDCIFDLYRTEDNGCLTLYFQIKITKATISNIDMICPNSLTHNECQPQEIISLKYESISWQYFLAGTSGYSIWNERDY
ncbi:type VI secretion system tube protein TssD [Proteus columbae]|uniref:type VI secretion system tube protein TssD n=1 Tax=Proteus columbae TaxID=1987580 RepID=UPI001599D1D3|nr:type VI secretion system tube protein TssD [Proteus columbae]QKJ49172.1 type VI secretion system tube protein Hcp [Proteus vulgaris]